MSADHGYGRYSSKTRPCRCEVCRAAKAEYMRERRAKANAAPSERVPHILHGSRASYEERGCRCTFCVQAKRVQWRVEGWAKADRRRAS